MSNFNAEARHILFSVGWRSMLDGNRSILDSEVLARSADMDLTGKLLIAMPGMGDPRFAHSVVLMCDHSDQGAMGLIVNKPSRDVRLSDLFKQLSIAVGDTTEDRPVYFGGPVEGARGFVLHSPYYNSELRSLSVSDSFAMTATMEILEDIAAGAGPAKAMMMLGYSGWGPGQLEEEIAMNGWLTADANRKLVYDLENGDKWSAALRSIGIDPLMLSASAGHA